MSETFIQQQHNAINAKGSLLVSASAGSGKTHVLVERVIKIITDEDYKTPADKLLIVTFTEAAANELKSRISARLTVAVAQDPNNQYLIKQKNLFTLASVGTIDSFCYKLIKDNFEKLELPDDLKIAGDSECVTAKSEAFSLAITRRFKEDKENCSKFLKSCFASGKSSIEAAQMLIDKLYDFSSNLSHPKKYLMQTADKLYAEGGTAVSICCKDLLNELNNVKNEILSALNQCEPHRELAEVTSVLNNICLFCDGLQEAFLTYSTNKIDAFLKTNIEYNIPEEKLEELQNIRKQPINTFVKKVSIFSSFLKKTNDIFSNNGEKLYEKLKNEKEFIKYLCDITLEYGENYKNTLISKNMLDFNLVERFAVKLLYDFNDNELQPSRYGKDLAQNFNAVLVDEFQDISALQYDLFYAISQNGKNLFAVGDIKQSIYRFRGSDPTLFEGLVERYKFYEKDDPENPQKIFLNCNFRSRSEICEFVNEFFKRFMSKKFGGTLYDQNQLLSPNGTFCENHAKPNVEICYTVSSEKHRYEYEAVSAAEKIKSIIQSGMQISDKEQGSRIVRYSDIAVISRHKKILAFYKEIFKKMQIPVSYKSNNMFDSSEIKLLISYLKLILNPHEDISLLSVLLSQLYAFSPNDILAIKTAECKSKSLFSKLLSLSGDNVKFEGFVKDYREVKEYSSVNSVGDTVLYIIEKYSLRDIVLTFDNGFVRKENLFAFEKTAYDFSNDEENISSFVSFIESYNEKGSKTPALNSDNTVKLMTMHASKGLQFPVCIIAGCSKELNRSGDKIENRFVTNESTGIGVKIRNFKNNTLYKSVAFNTIANENKIDDLSESIRLFYVALTRASDKLIIMNCTKSSLIKFFDTAIKHIEVLPGDDISFITCYSDLVNIFALQNLNSPVILDIRGYEVAPTLENEVCVSADYTENMELPQDGAPENAAIRADKDLVVKVKERLNYIYPYKDVNKIAAKSSVSALAKQNHDDYDFNARPVFALQGSLSSAQKGTALHKFMQFANFSAAISNLGGEIDRIFENGWLTLDEKDALNTDNIREFLNSDLLKRILSSPFVVREKQFLIELLANEVDHSLTKPLSDEKIVIQGAIDCLFEEDGKLVVVDFKTDRTKDAEVLRQRYENQLKYYQLACERIFNKEVKSKIIYSVFSGEEIEL